MVHAAKQRAATAQKTVQKHSHLVDSGVHSGAAAFRSCEVIWLHVIVERSPAIDAVEIDRAVTRARRRNICSVWLGGYCAFGRAGAVQARWNMLGGRGQLVARKRGYKPS